MFTFARLPNLDVNFIFIDFDMRHVMMEVKRGRVKLRCSKNHITKASGN